MTHEGDRHMEHWLVAVWAHSSLFAWVEGGGETVMMSDGRDRPRFAGVGRVGLASVTTGTKWRGWEPDART